MVLGHVLSGQCFQPKPSSVDLVNVCQQMRCFYCDFQQHAACKIQSTTDMCVFCHRQSNVPRLLPASDYCRAVFRCLNCGQRFDYCALGSYRKLGGLAKHWIDGSEKLLCQLSYEFYSPRVIGRRSKGATSRSAHIEKFRLKFFYFVVCNLCQSSASLAILVPL